MLGKTAKIAVAITLLIAVAFLIFLSFSINLTLTIFGVDVSFFLVPSSLLTVILISSGAAFLLIEKASKRRTISMWLLILAFSVFAFLLLKNVVNNLAGTVSPTYMFFLYVSFSFLGGSIVLTLGFLFNLFEDSSNRTLASMSNLISSGYKWNFIVGFSLTVYLSFVRPPLIEQNPTLTIVEWSIIAVVLAVLYINVRIISKELYVDSKSTEWRKHVQTVDREVPEEFDHLTFLQERFVNKGNKEPLLVYLTIHLHNIGKSEQQVMQTLSPLIYYYDKQPSIFAFPPLKENLARKNKDNRKKLLQDLMVEIRVS